jgi:hypothetical protein
LSNADAEASPYKVKAQLFVNYETLPGERIEAEDIFRLGSDRFQADSPSVADLSLSRYLFATTEA